MLKSVLVCVMSFVLSSAVVVAAPAIDSGARDMHGARYGEILVVTGRPGKLMATVYSTIGLNDCPDAQWKKLDASVLKKQLKSWAVVLNGPRYFLMNRIVTHRQPGPVTTFGGLAMRKMATLDLPRGTLAGGFHSTPYQERVVDRDTEWVFNKGTRVYELTSPRGDVYVMQSYALIVDPTLTLAALDGLGQRLKLGPGWTYATRVLPAELKVSTVGGKAHVIQDELQNTYQLRAR